MKINKERDESVHGVDTGRRKENKDNFALFSVASSKLLVAMRK